MCQITLHLGNGNQRIIYPNIFCTLSNDRRWLHRMLNFQRTGYVRFVKKFKHIPRILSTVTVGYKKGKMQNKGCLRQSNLFERCRARFLATKINRKLVSWWSMCCRIIVEKNNSISKLMRSFETGKLYRGGIERWLWIGIVESYNSTHRIIFFQFSVAHIFHQIPTLWRSCKKTYWEVRKPQHLKRENNHP